MLLRSFRNRDGQTVECGRVVVLVGPGNSGKSTLLRDIFRLLVQREPESLQADSTTLPPTVVLDDLEFSQAVVSDSAPRPGNGRTSPTESAPWRGLGPTLSSAWEVAPSAEMQSLLQRPTLTGRGIAGASLARLLASRVAYSQPASRAALVNSVEAISPAAVPSSLLQSLQSADPHAHIALADAFEELFPGQRIQLDDTERVRLALRIGAAFPERPEDPAQAVALFRQFARLDEQGDAYRNAAAILLGGLMAPGRLQLVDTPEFGLAPRQSARFGNWLARRTLSGGEQWIVATNSPELLAGLLSASDDVTVVQLKRAGSRTRFRTVPAKAVRAITKSPLLSQRQAVDCLFASGVVVTQADEDRAVYETVARQSHEDDGISFVHAHGRANLTLVTNLLTQAGIPAGVIADFDVLEDATAFAELVKALTGQEPPISWMSYRDKLASRLENEWDRDTLAASRREVEEFLEQFNRERAEGPSLPRPNDQPAPNKTTPWRVLARQGLDAVPDDLRPWLEQLVDEMQQQGLFVVPKGRLEGWIDFGGSLSRDDWFFNAMSDLRRGDCPADLSMFVDQALARLERRTTGAV